MKYSKIILSFVLSFILTLGVLELYLSGSEIITKNLNSFDDELGRTRRPNAPFVDFNEGFGLGSFNEFGYLGPGYPKEKKEGTMRIALMGDSYVEGFQVFDRHHFRFLLEEKLENELNQPVEVLNFGRSGFGIEDSYLYSKMLASQFQPDIVLCFVSNMSLNSLGGRSFLPKLEFAENDFENPSINTYYLNAERYKQQITLMQHSAFLQLGRNVFNQLKDRELTLKKIFDKLYIMPTLTVQPQHTPVDTEPKNENHDPKHIWIISQMEKEGVWIVNHGSDYLLIPNEYENNIILNANEVLSENGQYNWDYHYWQSTNKSGHWNHAAHQKIADALFKAVIEHEHR